MLFRSQEPCYIDRHADTVRGPGERPCLLVRETERDRERMRERDRHTGDGGMERDRGIISDVSCLIAGRLKVASMWV